MAERYQNSPAVLYEICNEPNGNVSWKNDVKPYAQEVVKTIRDAGSDGVILIGSPTWSQDIHLAAADPVQGKNLMYTLHFYAGTHGTDLRQRIDQVSLKTGASDMYRSVYDNHVGNGALVTGINQIRDPYLDIRYRNETPSWGPTTRSSTA